MLTRSPQPAARSPQPAARSPQPAARSPQPAARSPEPVAGPRPGLLASLGAWTWPGTAPDGREVAHVLLAHPPGRTDRDTPEAIEARMRLITQSLGGLAGACDRVPALHGRLQVGDDRVLMRFHGSRCGLRLPTHPRWMALVARSGEAFVMVGLDPLPQSADAARVDAYLDAVLAADRLLFGLARTTEPPQPALHDPQ